MRNSNSRVDDDGVIGSADDRIEIELRDFWNVGYESGHANEHISQGSA